MRILFISDNFPPEINAPATRTIEHCKEWVKSGAEVTVITCAPNFPQGKLYPRYKNKFYFRQVMDGIRVIRVWSYMTRNEGFFKRSLDYISFAVAAFIAGLFQKTDIIIATSPQFFTTLTGYALSALKRKPWVFELRDLWPESIKAVGAMKDTRLMKFLEKLELFFYRDAKVVISLTEAFKENIVSRGIDEKKVKVITNGVNLECYRPCLKNQDVLRRHNLEGKFIIGYVGTHGMAHSLEFVISALDKVSDQSIHFLFIGDGATKKTVVRIATQKELQNVTFLDPIAKELVPEYLSIIDVALVPLLKAETFKTVIPSKIFEAAAMKKPILLGVEGQSKEIVEKYNAGLCFEPENSVDFLEKLKLIKDDKKLYFELAEGCLKLAMDFDRARLAKKMFMILGGLVNRNIFTSKYS